MGEMPMLHDVKPMNEQARDAQRHADALGRHRDALVVSIARLASEQDALLDQMAAELSAH